MGKKAHDRTENSEIFYLLASSAFEKRMKNCSSAIDNMRKAKAPNRADRKV